MIKKKKENPVPTVTEESFEFENRSKNRSNKMTAMIGLEYDGICHHKVINDLIDHEEKVLSKISPKGIDNGFITVNDNGHGFKVEPRNDCWAASFIPGVALGNSEMDGDYAACAIVNTLNDGFVYASVNDNDEIEAIGPVVTPCIIGNHSKPYGIYIPMNNREAIMNGVNFALDFLSTMDNYPIKESPKSTKSDDDKLNW